jgi:bifunctional UDP-N-acetylglucosamine pyrophosphorylase/glucosamine-1-phosphate N-acetyltransferase
MNIEKLVITILAGGEGKRMKSSIPKVLHMMKEEPMLVRIIKNARQLHPYKIIVVTGRFHSLIIDTLQTYIDITDITFVNQPIPLGTGDAIKQCLSEYENNDTVMILNGDTPLLTFSIMNLFLQKATCSCAILVAQFDNPFGYGRIVYDHQSRFIGIIEEKDCNEHQKQINIVNTGIYLMNGSILKQFIPLITNNNKQNEYYLTDIVHLIKTTSDYSIDTVLLDTCDNKYISGVNTPEELEYLSSIA